MADSPRHTSKKAEEKFDLAAHSPAEKEAMAIHFFFTPGVNLSVSCPRAKVSTWRPVQKVNMSFSSVYGRRMSAFHHKYDDSDLE